MKKIVTISLAVALLVAGAVVASKAVETKESATGFTTYVADPGGGGR